MLVCLECDCKVDIMILLCILSFIACNPVFCSNPPPRCPENQCSRNATYKTCPNPCPGTCSKPTGVPNCLHLCVENGCECNPGYVLSDDGRCILLKDCPDYLRCNDHNATYTTCPNPCAPTCQNHEGRHPCILMCLKDGCQCMDGYYLNDIGKCVLWQDCPDYLRCNDRNATYTTCPNPCAPTCQNHEGRHPCTLMCLKDGCQCMDGYYLNDNGKCVLWEDCPAPQCDIPPECRPTCAVPNPPGCVYSPSETNLHGCNCQLGYILSNVRGKCVPIEQCPTNIGCNGDPHAEVRECPDPCPATCDAPDNAVLCKRLCYPLGCECQSGYIRSEPGGKCILPYECKDHLRCNDRNATYKACPNPCPRTCKYPGGTGVCNKQCLKQGCECKDGYYLTGKQKCMQLQDCPQATQCSANENFVFCNVGCPSNYCPEDDSRAMVACSPPFPCMSGCACKADYLRLSREDDRCIPASKCPPVCCTRPHEVWDSCPPPCLLEKCSEIGLAVKCDRRYFPCRPRCLCKPGFRRDDSDICVPEEKCPLSIICGENEVASKCRVICPPQTCDSIFTTYDCEGKDYCEPGCDCKDGYLRNADGVCVPSEQCFTAPQCDIPPECRPTCAVPNHPGCVYSPSESNQDGCNCQLGYILSDVGGQCIPVEKCPTNITCNGDPNALVRQCPQPCPSTCDAPDNAMYCKRKCDDLGCDCKPGYIRSQPGGKCIKPENCKGGNPCGPNGTFVSCKVDCPFSYCPADDNRGVVICDPPPPQYCSSGCICRLNYRKFSREDQRCIRSDQCPPVNCTRPYEQWNPCPIECNSGYCDEVDQPPATCNTLVLNCNPQCTCKETYFRNPNTDICVSSEECREINKEQECKDTECL